ncbi:MBL fold metallo-hydrolase [Patulibacter minatonensis]|uniref:MBL fold metallo-hydrolase n=1 Tax=Patulibacter minatonensis TaxID=298163 RepID=UPI00047E36AC|nr:MBL fold metallo-hydrolase [Patulibacter minatonensis]
MSTAADQPAPAVQLPDGIVTFEVPTPFGVGPVNVYVVEGPLTLVDTGPATALALETLERELGARGHRVEDLERIVLTHHHVDHFGLAGQLVRRSGAEVHAFGGIAGWLGDYAARATAEMRFIEKRLIRHGLPPEVALGARAADTLVRGYAESVAVDHELAEGGVLRFDDREWQVHHRPGHSTSDTVFHDRAARTLVAGDHLLAQVSSNAVLSEPLGTDEAGADPTERLTPLRDYAASLDLTHAMDVDLVLAGHGPPVTDHRELIERRVASREKRLDRIVGEVAAGHATAFDVGRVIWGRTAFVQVHLVMSEVIGHLELLEGAGRIVGEEQDGVLRFRVA